MVNHPAVTQQHFQIAVGAYVASLLVTLGDIKLWVATSAMMAGLAALAVHIAPALATYDALKLMGFAYIGQELAHIVTGEKTFQSTYQAASPTFLALLLEYTYFLLPLCIDALVNMKASFAEWIVAHNYVVRCKLENLGRQSGAQDHLRLRHRRGSRPHVHRALVVPEARGQR